MPGKLGSPWEYGRQTDDADRAFASLVRTVEGVSGVTMKTVDSKGHYLLAEFPSKVCMCTRFAVRCTANASSAKKGEGAAVLLSLCFSARFDVLPFMQNGSGVARSCLVVVYCGVTFASVPVSKNESRVGPPRLRTVLLPWSLFVLIAFDDHGYLVLTERRNQLEEGKLGHPGQWQSFQ